MIAERPEMRGEGVQSFSRAFLAAGARSTVTTLWRVADGPTAEFMTVFYHHLQLGEPRAEALRQAKLRFIRSGTALARSPLLGGFRHDGRWPPPGAPRGVVELAGTRSGRALAATPGSMTCPFAEECRATLPRDPVSES